MESQSPMISTAKKAPPWGLDFLAILVCLLLAIVPAVIWPGDAPWVMDDAAELSIALHANQTHTLAVHGLAGNFYLHYGPLPMHLYQVMLLLSHDPRVIVVLRGLFCSAITAGSLLWLGRNLRLNNWFVGAVMLAPYVWLNNRMMWAASIAVPIACLAVAAYASFLRKRNGWTLVLAVGAAAALLFIHPQTAPLSAALGGHILWKQHRALWRHRLGILGILILLTVLEYRYIEYSVHAFNNRAAASLRAGYPSQTSPLEAWSGPLMGGCLFSGRYATLQGSRSFLTVLARLSSISIYLVWAGVAIALYQCFRQSHAGTEHASPSSNTMGGACPAPTADGNSPATVGNAMLGIALAVLAIQAVYFGILRVPPWPQYFFGTFPLHVLLAWFAIQTLPRRYLRAAVIGVYGLSLAIGTLGSMWQVHRDGWTPAAVMSPTLTEQINLAKALNAYSNEQAWTDVEVYQREYAHALWALRQFVPPEPNQPRRDGGRLVIRYRQAQPLGRIELIEAQSDADIPPNAKLVWLHYPPSQSQP